jgi:hypothetical protein
MGSIEKVYSNFSQQIKIKYRIHINLAYFLKYKDYFWHEPEDSSDI